jgi:hypothetical protein
MIMYQRSEGRNMVYVVPFHGHVVYAVDTGYGRVSEDLQQSSLATNEVSRLQILRGNPVTARFTIELVKACRPDGFLLPAVIFNGQFPHVVIEVVDRG